MKAITNEIIKRANAAVNPIRPMILFMKKHYNSSSLVGAEIGVFKGKNAYNILNNLNIKKLYLIDPYENFQLEDLEKDKEHIYNYLELNTKDDIASFKKNMKSLYNEARERLNWYKGKIEFIKLTSEKAVETFPDEYFDFVYIDGNHLYEYVIRDIELYYPKVKDGGVIGGHDFFSDRICNIGVTKAVLDYVSKHNLQLYYERAIAVYDWWIVKGRDARNA